MRYKRISRMEKVQITVKALQMLSLVPDEEMPEVVKAVSALADEVSKKDCESIPDKPANLKGIASYAYEQLTEDILKYSANYWEIAERNYNNRNKEKESELIKDTVSQVNSINNTLPDHSSTIGRPVVNHSSPDERRKLIEKFMSDSGLTADEKQKFWKADEQKPIEKWQPYITKMVANRPKVAAQMYSQREYPVEDETETLNEQMKRMYYNNLDSCIRDNKPDEYEKTRSEMREAGWIVPEWHEAIQKIS